MDFVNCKQVSEVSASDKSFGLLPLTNALGGGGGGGVGAATFGSAATIAPGAFGEDAGVAASEVATSAGRLEKVGPLPGTYVGIAVVGVMMVVNSDAHLDSTPFCKYGRKDLS